MFEMTHICVKWLEDLNKRLKYVRNDVDLWEIAQIYGKWLKYLINGLNMWEMTYVFGKWLQYLRDG